MNIYILQGEEQLGPYTMGEINDRLASGQVTVSTLAWFEGSPEWVPLGNIREIAAVTSVVAQLPPVGRQANCDIPTSAGRVEPLGSLDQDTTAKLSEVSSAGGVIGDESKGSASVRSTDDRRGKGGKYLLACVVAVGVAMLAWMLTRSAEPKQTEGGKPVDTVARAVDADHLEDDTRSVTASPSTYSADRTPVAVPPPASPAAPNNVTPSGEVTTGDADDVEYRDPVIESYLKLTPAERERTSHERSRADAEMIWLYYFKGRDANGRPIPYTAEEIKANERAYSTACKLAQEQQGRMFSRQDDSFFTTIHSDGANRSAWYLHEYKEATYRVSQDRLTEVERMNGWQWSGTVYYESKFTRTFTGTEEAPGVKIVSNAPDWSHGATFLSVALRCRAGKWTITKIDSVQGCTKPTDAELLALAAPQARDAKTHPADGGDDLRSPVGRYKKAVYNAIRARWYFMVNEQIGRLSAGAGKIHFVVDAAGRVTGPKVVSGDGNNPLAKLSVTAIEGAELPAMPADLKAMLGDKPFEMDYEFHSN